MFREKIKAIENFFEDVIFAIETAIEKTPDILLYILGNITGFIIIVLIDKLFICKLL